MFFGLIFSVLLTIGVAMPAAAQEKSLYQRVGGYDALAAVVDVFIVRLVTDKQFEKFFAGASNDSKKRIRQHILDQFCAATGGPCVYMGRDMKTSHTGLGITNAEWDAAAKLLQQQKRDVGPLQQSRDQRLGDEARSAGDENARAYHRLR